MNIGIDQSKVDCLVEGNYNAIFTALKKQLGSGNELLLTESIMGCGRLIWLLPGDGWMVLSASDISVAQEVRRELAFRKENICAMFGNAPMIQIILSVPNDDYIYYKYDDAGHLVIKLVAWGYRFRECVDDYGCASASCAFDDLPMAAAPSIRHCACEKEASLLPKSQDEAETYSPRYESVMKTSMQSFWKKLFRKKKNDEVYSSVFAPAEMRRGSHFLIQVYLHLYEEADKVKSLAAESDNDAKRRDYVALQMKLKQDDKVDVELNIYGRSRLTNIRKSVLWRGAFTKCSFDYLVPQNIDVSELSSEINMYVNGVLLGEMRFITKIVYAPRNLYSEILSRTFKKIFISYAHQDIRQVRNLALAYKAQGVDYFFDRDKLKAGDVYEEKIFQYIDSADLFILCWSKNAAQSDYVAKEKKRALSHAYPQLSYEDATLKIFPISMEPRADLPKNMEEIYNFEVI